MKRLEYVNDPDPAKQVEEMIALVKEFSNSFDFSDEGHVKMYISGMERFLEAYEHKRVQVEEFAEAMKRQKIFDADPAPELPFCTT